MLKRVEFEDVGVDGVFRIITGVLAAGGHHDAGDLRVLGAKVCERHRRSIAGPRAHTAGDAVVTDIGQQVEVGRVGGIDSDCGNAALGHRQGDGAVNIDTQGETALGVPDARRGCTIDSRQRHAVDRHRTGVDQIGSGTLLGHSVSHGSNTLGRREVKGHLGSL